MYLTPFPVRRASVLAHRGGFDWPTRGTYETRVFRIFLSMLLVLVAFLVGFYLGNEPVSHLTQSINGLTIELDTMREHLAAPAAAAPQEGAVKATDELHVINEGIAALRQELAEQKTLIARTATAAPAEAGTGSSAELLKARSDLEACNADKLDLQARCRAAAAAAEQGAPTPAPPADSAPAQAPGYRYQPYGTPR